MHAIIAAIVACSRWLGEAEVSIELRAGDAVHALTARIATDMTACGVAAQLADVPVPASGVVEIRATEAADLPALSLRLGGDAAQFDGGGAGHPLTALASAILRDLDARPDAGLATLAPAAFAPIDGTMPPDLPGRGAPLTGGCVDMTSGESLSGPAFEGRVAGVMRTLLAHGIGPGAVVGVALPRGNATVAAWVAVLRTGAAFLQLEPDLAPERRARMIDEAAPALVLIPSPADAALFDDAVATAVVENAAAPRVDLNTLAAPGDDDPAYLIFTSGSTGTPKAVVIGRGALDHHTRAAADAFGLTARDRVLSFAALGFDVAVEEILPTLRAGATVVLRSDEMLDTLDRFVDELHAQRITVLNIPTAFWRLLTANLHVSHRKLPADLRLVIVGGERVPAASLEKWRQVAPNVTFMNGYGPTETTATATIHVDRGEPLDWDSVPIGGPLGAARLAVLAPDGSPAPQGRPGELWIGGPGVGLGYLKRPDQTAERFRALPGASDRPDGQRWFRTGDRVQQAGGGELVYLDRIDRQLKLSGYRIEPAGIEASLSRLPGVTEAHVAAHADVLVAWVAGTADEQAVRAVLRAELPPAMSPRVVLLPDMPRNERGKLDTAALRRLAAAGTRAAEVAARPADPAVETVARIMGDLLQQKPLHPDQSFFDQGGNSLLAIELSERLAGLFGRRPTLPAIYNQPTPSALARILQAGDAASDERLVAIQPHGDGIPLLALHVLGTNANYYRPLAQALGTGHPVWGLTVGLLTAETPTEVTDLADLYLRQIQQFRPTGPVAIAGISLGGHVAYEVAVRLRRAGRDVRMLALLDTEGPGLQRRASLDERVRRLVNRFRDNTRGALRHYAVAARDEAQLGVGLLRIHLRRLTGRRLERPLLADFVAANVASVAAYRPPVYPGRVVVFAANEELGEAERAGLSALGWKPVCPDLRFAPVPGDHLGIMEQPGVAHIARVIVEELREPRPVPVAAGPAAAKVAEIGQSLSAAR